MRKKCDCLQECHRRRKGDHVAQNGEHNTDDKADERRFADGFRLDRRAVFPDQIQNQSDDREEKRENVQAGIRNIVWCGLLITVGIRLTVGLLIATVWGRLRVRLAVAIGICLLILLLIAIGICLLILLLIAIRICLLILLLIAIRICLLILLLIAIGICLLILLLIAIGNCLLILLLIAIGICLLILLLIAIRVRLLILLRRIGVVPAVRLHGSAAIDAEAFIVSDFSVTVLTVHQDSSFFIKTLWFFMNFQKNHNIKP